MKREDFSVNANGRLITARRGAFNYVAFVPNALPPDISFTPELTAVLSAADRAVGALAEAGSRLPNPYLLITPNIRREAVLSSRIEGTVTALSDLFFFEAAPSAPLSAPDVKEVANYVKAMEYGLRRVKELPISTRLIKEIHNVLLQDVRGAHATPGELRTSQNWIGPPGCTLNEAVFVPPPAAEMREALGQWEIFINSPANLPPLILAGLLHYQLEAIHPFVDGNGRVGRLLITLFLCEAGTLPLPLLYLSGYFERTRDEYYDWLLAVSRAGDWPGWLLYFLTAVTAQAEEALECARALLSLRDRYLSLLKELGFTKAMFGLIDKLIENPFVTAPQAAKKIGVSYPAVQNAIKKLINAGLLREITGQRRNRVYLCEEVLEILEPRRRKTRSVTDKH